MPEEGTISDAPITPAEPVTEAAPTETDDATVDWKAKAREWERRAKDNSAKLREATPKLAEYDRLVEASRTDLERAQEATKAAEERVNGLTTRTVKAEVKALATGAFADPDDVAAFLDLLSYGGADGEVDATKITADLADLLARKPYLGKAATSRLPAPNPAAGMAAAGSPTLDDAISAAQKAGNFREVIRLQNQKLAAPAAR